MLVALCVLGSTTAAQAAARADLTVTRISATPAAVPAGGQLTVRVTVRNAGRKRAARSAVTLLLSSDRKRSRTDVGIPGAAGVKALARRRRASTAPDLSVPRSIAPGRYFVLACADGAKRVRERSEKNNCRATRAAIQVTAVSIGGPLTGGPAALAPTASGGTAAGGGGPTGSGGGSAGAGGGDGLAPDSAFGGFGTFLRAANPLSVTPTPDTARAKTQSMGQFGGSMSVTGADGTVYTLALPKDALLVSEDITMTPVSSIGGLPFAQQPMGAVELKPHGLQLAKEATLTIDPPDPHPPLGEQTAFLAHAGGEDFHLYPLGPEATPTLRLMHFSTPGVGVATPGERGDAASRTPARPLAQLEQALAELARARRAGENPSFAGYQEGMFAYYDEVVRPQLKQAEGNEQLASEAIAAALSWARNLALLGLDSGPDYELRDTDLWTRVERVVRNAIEETFTRCVRDHDLPAAGRLLGWLRQAAILGFESDFTKFVRCARFEVDFDSTITTQRTLKGETQDHESSGTFHVAAEDVPIQIGSLSPGALAHQKDTAYKAEITYPPSYDGCVLVSHTEYASAAPGELRAYVMWDVNPFEAAGSSAAPPRRHKLRLLINGPVETYRNWNTGCSSGESTQTGTRWRDLFYGMRPPSVIPDLELDAAEQEGPLIAAKRIVNRRDVNSGNTTGTDQQETFIELWHTPQP